MLLQTVILLPFVLIVLAAWIQLVVLALIWSRCRRGGVHIPFTRIVWMLLRRINPSVVCRAAVRLHETGEELSLDDLEKRFLAGDDLDGLGLGEKPD